MARTGKLTRGVLCAVIAVAVAPASACGTDAVAVDACRRIESARCVAAAKCGGRFEINDVDSCQRFYDAQCLHGFAANDSPGIPDVNRCVAAIRAAGECAESDGEGAACGDIDTEGTDSVSACEIVAHPEKAIHCSFLSAPSDQSEDADDSEDASSAGAGGTAGVIDGETDAEAAGEGSGLGGDTD